VKVSTHGRKVVFCVRPCPPRSASRRRGGGGGGRVRQVGRGRKVVLSLKERKCNSLEVEERSGERRGSECGSQEGMPQVLPS